MAKATSGSSNDFQELQMFPVTEYLAAPSVEATSVSVQHSSSSILFHLSLLKDKISQLHNLVAVLVSPEQNLPHESTSMAMSSIDSTIQEIIVAATSMRFTCQQMAPPFGSTSGTTNQLHHQQQIGHHRLQHHQSNFDNNRGVPAGNINIGSDVTIKERSLFSNTEAEPLDWFVENYSNNNNNNSTGDCNLKGDEANRGELMYQRDETDIIELDAVDLLARYTHFCQVCGKGFKRDANLRMHMRAHGDEYKTSAALSNPMKNIKGSLLGEGTVTKKYSCPQEGCRWNQKHARFQPLKSMVCVKNHYKRSHCPKMYVCKRCNQKQFSVLSDLRTHEKHCGDPRWLCSCGTTFSRKDKLMGHVALFVGHTPAINNASEKSRLHVAGTSSST